MKVEIDKQNFELLIAHDQLKKRIRLIGIQLNVSYEKQVPVFVGILDGSFMFMADLMKEIDIAAEISFVKISSYEGDRKKGELRRLLGLDISLGGRDVVIVEDIVDTGETVSDVVKLIRAESPASVAVCSLLLKPDKLENPIPELAYVGFEIENDFVVGYGLDYNGLGRHLRDIYKAC